jgi:hypothetical protein
MQGSDHQFIYDNATPHAVYSVGHGHFFPSGPDWTSETLAVAGPPVPDAAVIAGAGLSDHDLDDARAALHRPTNEEIATAVTAPPDTWGLTNDEAPRTRSLPR